MVDAVNLAPGLRRITAPNPGPMTGAGTNTYILGSDRIAVVDPGPAIPSHIDLIVDSIAEAGGAIEWIFVTHTHGDHSPGAALLAEKTGAPCVGRLSSLPQFQDASFIPDIQLQHDALFRTDEFSLRAIHTPGHVDNHFCFLLENEGLLLAGDHLMNGSTVVIIPPQGDMRAYIASLEFLLDYDLRAIAPGHGELIEHPKAVIEHTVRHRFKREAKVLSCLEQVRCVSIAELVVAVYDDVDAGIYRMAELSLWAHLIKLESDGRVCMEENAEAQPRDKLWRVV